MKIASFIRSILFTIIAFYTLHYLGTTGNSSIFFEEPIMWAVLGALVVLYVAGEICVHAMNFVLYGTLSDEAKKRFDAQALARKKGQLQWYRNLYKKLEGSKPIAEEDEIILDHNYDGIRELDNKLPPWWVYGFYATIIFAAVYMVRYHIFDGKDQHEEYEIAMAQARAQIEEYKRTAKDLVDVNTVEQLTSSEDINAGKTIFTANCVACHKETGAGGIGPNLTDDYWILGGGIKNVFNTISEGGRSGKGMIAWKTDLKPSEMAQVASYVLSLHGTNPPDGKEPQGEIWMDEDAAIEEASLEVEGDTIQLLMEDEPVTEDIIKSEE